jgi:predicted PurR-regulated permease PerM
LLQSISKALILKQFEVIVMKYPFQENWINQLENSRLIRYLLLFALGWAIAQFLGYFQTVFTIFILAAIFAFLLNYPTMWLSQFVAPRLAATIIFLLALTLFLGALGTIGVAMLSQAQQLAQNAPDLFNSFNQVLEDLEQFLGQWNVQLNMADLGDQLRSQTLSGIGIGLTTFQKLLTNLLDVIVIAVITYFMLLDGKRLWHFFLNRFSPEIREDLAIAIQQNFLGFFWGRLLLSIFFGASAFIVFLVLKIPYALILAAIAGVFDLIPGIGATLGISLVSIIVLPQGVWLSLKVLVGCIVLQQIEENLLMPYVMRGSININPVIMFLALLIGAKVAGLFGVFLAIPLMGTIISLFNIEEMKAADSPGDAEPVNPQD